MSRNSQQFGSVTLARARSSADLKLLLKDSLLKTNTIIIKPNWVGVDLGLYTDCETLRMLFEAIDSRIVVTEAYQLHRSTDRQREGVKFTVNGKERSFRWLLRGGWEWVQKNSSWDWFKDEYLWDFIRKLDNWFLDEHGFTDLFKEFEVEYINVTEEVWQGRTVDAEEIKKTVETKFDPIFVDKLYSYVPQRLYDLRGATFISFAKVKHYATFTMKNIFGLIPDPLRAWWHGPSNKRLDKSVVDVNKIYASLFNIYGICEALRYTAVNSSEGEFGEQRMRYNVAKDLGILAFGRHLVSVDAILFSLLGLDPQKIGYLKLGGEVFGDCQKGHVEAAKASAVDWFSFRVPF